MERPPAAPPNDGRATYNRRICGATPCIKFARSSQDVFVRIANAVPNHQALPLSDSPSSILSPASYLANRPENEAMGTANLLVWAAPCSWYFW